MKKKFKKHAFPLLLLIIISLIGAKALLKPGFFTSHDGEHQLARQYIFHKALKAGHFPPRFDRQLQNNLGYPLFTYTYQFPFWLGEIFLSLGTSIPDAVKFTFVLTFIASAITMYIFVQEKWGKAAALLAGFMYIWAPYRFLTIFVRASLGEHVALMFIPLIFWSINSLKNYKLKILIGAFSSAALLLSHSMVAQMTVLPLLVFIVFRLFEEKHKIKLLKQLLLITIFSLGLSLFYLLPALYYRSSIQGLNRTFYAEHFVAFKQLIYSPWGYTFSVHGLNDGLSFQIGIAQWITVFLSIILLAFYKKYKKSAYLLPFILSFGLSIFFMTASSSKFWEMGVKNWLIIDIPWRLLSITTFCAAVIAAIVYSLIKQKVIKLVFLVLLLFTAFYTNRNHLRVNKYIVINPDWFINYKGTSNSYDEYKPVHTNQDLLKVQDLKNIDIISGESDINITKDLPHQLVFTSDSSDKTTLRINTVYFPGFKLIVDNQSIDIKSSLSSGVPQIDLTPGKHMIKLQYEQTPLMRFANIISASSLLLLVILCLKNNQK